MKTKTIKLALELPVSDAEILRGLETLDSDPDLAAADRRLAAARGVLSTAQKDLELRETDARRLPPMVMRGEATPADLDAAQIAVRTAAALVTPAQAAVADAEAGRSRALTAAKDRALQIVTDRFEALRRTDEALVAQLDALDEAYDAMTAALARLCLDPARGVSDYDVPSPGALPNRARRVLRSAAMVVDRKR